MSWRCKISSYTHSHKKNIFQILGGDRKTYGYVSKD
nr:MAG TPA: hypothetical protein [Caudoviricetes sp.]